MKVRYGGTMPGYHCGVRLLPGENDVADDVARELIQQGVCEAVEQEKPAVPKLRKDRSKAARSEWRSHFAGEEEEQ